MRLTGIRSPGPASVRTPIFTVARCGYDTPRPRTGNPPTAACLASSSDSLATTSTAPDGRTRARQLEREGRSRASTCCRRSSPSSSAALIERRSSKRSGPPGLGWGAAPSNTTSERSRGVAAPHGPPEGARRKDAIRPRGGRCLLVLVLVVWRFVAAEPREDIRPRFALTIVREPLHRLE